MERLLVANFDGDSEFEALEPQVFDDPVNGTGMRVLCYRKDGRVEVYWNPGVQVDPATFTVGAGVAALRETPIEPSRFEISRQALEVDLAFDDVRGRRIEMRIHEDRHGRAGFPLLAPVGADIAEPKQLFLVFMPEIDLVRRADSGICIRIGGRTLPPSSLPVLLGGKRVWFIRYAAGPIIGTLNPPAEKPLEFEAQSSGDVDAGGMTVSIDADGTVSRLCRESAELRFQPGFPNLIGLEEGRPALGRWTIQLGGAPITGGSYTATRNGTSIALAMDVTDHWQPTHLPLAMKIFVHLMRKFRTWPSTYRWRGVVRDGTTPRMSSAWERVR